MFHIIQNHFKCVALLLLASTIVIALVVYMTLPVKNEDDDFYLNIPNGFLIGAGSSACQIEGAWNVSGKSESELDKILHSNYSSFADNLDIASDSYHHYMDDIKALKYMGANVYRFSFSWPRLFPTGHSDNVNKEGVQYYHKILDELEKYNIQPIVTLYHFDHPYWYGEIGGWTNEKIIYYFEEYARFVFKEFGDRVKIFSTINEPLIVGLFCQTDWLRDIKKRNFTAGYICMHNLLKAHARVYHIYDEEFRPTQNGVIGIVLNCDDSYSKDPDDHESPNIFFEYSCGSYANPLFSKTGDYPEIVKQRIAENSKFEGLKESRLPSFNKTWIDYIRGSSDYLGINHYNTYVVEPAAKGNKTIWLNDVGIHLTLDPRTYISKPMNISIRPEGIRSVLLKIKEKYDNPLVFIMENGVPTVDDLYDYSRIKYLYTFFERVLYAIKYDKCNVKSYIVWSLIDSFEFLGNKTFTYGLVHVNFRDPNRPRTLKASATWLRNVIAKKRLYFDINEEFRNINLYNAPDFKVT